MAKISIEDLAVKAGIGIYNWEKQITQTLLIDLVLQVSYPEMTDNIEDTLDYAAVCIAVKNMLEEKHFNLIETVCCSIAKLLNEKFAIKKMLITVKKPQAVDNAKMVSYSDKYDFS